MRSSRKHQKAIWKEGPLILGRGSWECWLAGSDRMDLLPPASLRIRSPPRDSHRVSTPGRAARRFRAGRPSERSRRSPVPLPFGFVGCRSTVLRRRFPPQIAPSQRPFGARHPPPDFARLRGPPSPCGWGFSLGAAVTSLSPLFPLRTADRVLRPSPSALGRLRLQCSPSPRLFGSDIAVLTQQPTQEVSP